VRSEDRGAIGLRQQALIQQRTTKPTIDVHRVDETNWHFQLTLEPKL